MRCRQLATSFLFQLFNHPDFPILLAQQARQPVPHYEHLELGYNYRLSNVLAAIGVGQLELLARRVERRRDVFATYQRLLGDLPGVAFMPDDLHSLDIAGGAPMLNFHMYGLAIPQLFKRQYYNERDHSWHYYPPHTDIRDARNAAGTAP